MEKLQSCCLARPTLYHSANRFTKLQHSYVRRLLLLRVAPVCLLSCHPGKYFGHFPPDRRQVGSRRNPRDNRCITVFHRLIVVLKLDKWDYAENSLVVFCFVLKNSVLFKLLCVWIV